MKCLKCQVENPADARFCNECGSKLDSACPACGKTNPPGSKFCNGCGQNLKEPSTPPLDLSHPHSDAPDLLAEKILTTPDTIDGERKHVTVLFSDLSGYTTMAEKLDPEEIKEITSRIFGEIASIVSRYDGFVEKYIGDAIVALFGVPKAHEDDHLRAIRAARDIHESVDGIGRQYQEKIGRRLTLHSGIVTGLVVTGEVNMEKGTHGVAGDTINLASRLSGLAQPGEILVGEATYLQSNGAFSFERLQPASVKGRAEPVTLYRLLEKKEEPARGLATQGISSPLVGRSAEVAAIRASVNRLLDGQGGILSVIGEAGLGKSRLLAEIRHQYQNDALWLEGRTLSYGQKMSYWPFREILWQYVTITEDDSDTDAWRKFEQKIVELFPDESGEILPYLPGLMGLEVRGDLAKNLKYLDGEAMGRQIYLSSRRFFERLAETPLVLVFEDLHWADESTVALIAHLFPLTTRVPLLICGISRPDIAVPAARLRDIAFKDHERRYTEIRLSPLSSAESTDLINNLLTIESLPSRTRELILQRAEGNPFFLEEIMRTLIDKGAVHSENGHWKATSEIETVTIPDTIQGVILARIDRLDEAVKQILKTASVIGRAFLYRLLKEVTDAVKELDRHLDTLTATELIREKQKTPELEYIFKHALVQESTYESILLKKRHELHGKVGSAIETLFSDRLDEFSSVLAYHFAKAEHWEKAQEYLFKAGDQAGRIAADAEALTHYQEALETYARAFGDKWDPVQRGILERKMGEAFYRLGEPDTANEYFQRALAYFGRPKLPTSKSRVGLSILKEIGTQIAHRMFSRWLVKKTFGQVDQAVEEVARIYEMMTTIDVATAPEHLLLATLTCLNFSERKGHLPGIVSESASLHVIAHIFRFFRLARSLLRRAEMLSTQTQDPMALVRVCLNVSLQGWSTGHLDKGVEYGLKGADIARRGCWDPKLWGYANTNAASSFLYGGDFASAFAIAQETARFGQDANDREILCMGLCYVGGIQQYQGEFEHAATNLIRAIELSEEIPNHLLRRTAGFWLGACFCRMGDVERSIRVLTESGAYGAAHGDKGWEFMLPLAFFRTYLVAAELDIGPKRNEQLKKARQACKQLFRWGNGYRVCLPEAARLQGVYDLLAGKQASAEKHWRRSLALAEEMGMRYDLAMTHLEMGKRLSDPTHLRQAEAIFADIGAEFDLAETRRFMQPLAERKGT
jgi:class 3 adenylate cyclase/tetratricopeptide (TPR) repeat protein